jgi:hypothetical protein
MKKYFIFYPGLSRTIPVDPLLSGTKRNFLRNIRGNSWKKRNGIPRRKRQTNNGTAFQRQVASASLFKRGTWNPEPLRHSALASLYVKEPSSSQRERE